MYLEKSVGLNNSKSCPNIIFFRKTRLIHFTCPPKMLISALVCLETYSENCLEGIFIIFSTLQLPRKYCLPIFNTKSCPQQI